MIADELSRIAMSPSLGGALARAGELARRQGHVEVTLEHMLLSLCEDPDAMLVLAASNIDAARLKGDVVGYLAALPKRGVPGQMGEAAVSLDLRRILEAAAAAARGGRRREINGAIVLAAIVGDGRSPAAHLLQSQGLTFDGAIRALQRGASAPAHAAPSSTEDILARARARVQSRTELASRKAEANRPAAREEPAAEPTPQEAPSPAVDYDDVPPTATPRVETAAPAKAAPDSVVSPPAAEPQPPPQVQSPNFSLGAELGTRAEPERSPPPVAPAPPAAPVPPVMAPPPPPVAAPVPPPIPPAHSLPAANDGPTPGTLPPPFWPSASPGSPMSPMPPPIPPARVGGEVRAPVRVGAAPEPPSVAHWPQEPRRPMGVGSGDSGRAPHELDRFTLSRRLQAGPAPAPPVGARPVPAPRAEIGQLVENIPRTMRVAIPVLVEVRIAKAEVQALAEGLQGGGAAYHHEVTITKAMSVRLRAPDGGFFIETASPETQWIERALQSSDDFASWRWHVTPRERGKKRLQLIISARTVGTDGLAAETALPDQVITIRVRTNYAKSFSHLVGWGVAALIGGLLAKFGESALDAGLQVVAKLTAG